MKLDTTNVDVEAPEAPSTNSAKKETSPPRNRKIVWGSIFAAVVVILVISLSVTLTRSGSASMMEDSMMEDSMMKDSGTIAPLGGASEFAPILTAELSGQYNIGGKLTIDYVQDFEDGQAVERPRLFVDIPNRVDAPGPYLYLSKRPYSETKGGDLDDEDIFIPIDSASDGKFNANGVFDQFLDEINNVSDLNEYANGSWIVWCRPFGVYLGGGEIMMKEVEDSMMKESGDSMMKESRDSMMKEDSP